MIPSPFLSQLIMEQSKHSRPWIYFPHTVPSPSLSQLIMEPIKRSRRRFWPQGPVPHRDSRPLTGTLPLPSLPRRKYPNPNRPFGIVPGSCCLGIQGFSQTPRILVYSQWLCEHFWIGRSRLHPETISQLLHLRGVPVFQKQGVNEWNCLYSTAGIHRG